MTRLEEIDRAICKRLPVFRDFTPEVRRSVCRAVLEALKKPSDKMLAATNWPDDTSEEIFTNMIQAALDEK